MDTSPQNAHPSLGGEVKRRWAKERAYVLFQSSGWLFFFVLQATFSLYFGDTNTVDAKMTLIATLVMVSAEGLLITHYARPFIARWGWKQLRWQALVPRVVVMSLVLSLIWSAVGYGYKHGVLHLVAPKR